MAYTYTPQLSRHKLFTSYYHYDDQYYKDQFVSNFGYMFINTSVGLGDINSDVSAEYIKQLIQKEYITDSSILIVLVSPNTKKRKHIDWEISAALSKKVGGYSGLLGILLPTFPVSFDRKYYLSDLPGRLADNVTSGYTDIYLWNDIIINPYWLYNAINTAFNRRIVDSYKINNSRIQMKYNG